MATSLDEMAAAQNTLLEDFRSITGANEAMALDFMEDNLWDLDQAINAFFDSGSASIPDGSDGSHAQPITVSDSQEASDEQTNTSSQEPKSLKFLTWNVDGLDEVNLKERTRAVVNFINNEKPDIVYLQEVVQETLGMYEKLCKGYECMSGMHCCPAYFNAILYNKATINATAAPTTERFSQTKMGRHLLIQPVLCKGRAKLVLMTSHLESTVNCQAERKRQLQQVLHKISEQPQDVTVLFAGDMNLRDKEVKSIGGLPDGVVDIWEEWGRNPDTQYTWDISKNDNLDWQYPNKPKLRFDRVFIRIGMGKVKPCKFELVGKERVPSCDRFPSDHWGIWCEFLLQ